ncbi:MAG: methionyl-tRNA formyltransferase [Patescibacteria group bacterium]
MSIVKCKIIFFGTPNFAVPTLEALNEASARGGQGFLSIKAVVTQPDKAVGRHHSQPIPSPVKQAAQALNLPVLEGLDSLRGIEADLGIVVAFGEILPQWIIDIFPLGIVNIHPSLLPKYRGTSPIQGAILNQEKETGVTIIKLDDEMDHGPILAQQTVGAENFLPLRETTAGELYDKLFQMGADLLIKILPDYIAGKIELKPQDDSLATFTKKLSKEDGKIDWTKSPAEIAAHVRAMNPWPGAWTMWSPFAKASEDKKEKRLIVWKASLKRHPELVSGSISEKDPDIRQDDVELCLEEVQLEGKKKMAFTEFCKGHPDFKLSNLFSNAKS